ncbi:MAG: DUF4124 domain-containing protein [Burkholderiales bacterium]|jgi:hypothetical protein
MKRLSAVLGLALCVALPAAAQMYKWVDADGKVKYSDTPPPSNVKTEKLRIPAHAANPPAGPAQKGAAKSGPKGLAEQEQAFRKRQADAAKEQQEQSQKEAEARDRAENCKRAKAALANLELGGRQTRIDSKGERVFLTDQEIAQATAQARQEAAAACN